MQIGIYKSGKFPAILICYNLPSKPALSDAYSSARYPNVGELIMSPSQTFVAYHDVKCSSYSLSTTRMLFTRRCAGNARSIMEGAAIVIALFIPRWRSGQAADGAWCLYCMSVSYRTKVSAQIASDFTSAGNLVL